MSLFDKTKDVASAAAEKTGDAAARLTHVAGMRWAVQRGLARRPSTPAPRWSTASRINDAVSDTDVHQPLFQEGAAHGCGARQQDAEDT